MFKSKDIDSWAVLNFAAAEPRFRAISAQQARAIAQRLHREGSNFGLVSSNESKITPKRQIESQILGRYSRINRSAPHGNDLHRIIIGQHP